MAGILAMDRSVALWAAPGGPPDAMTRLSMARTPG